MWYNEALYQLREPEVRNEFVSRTIKADELYLKQGKSYSLDKLSHTILTTSKNSGILCLRPITYPETMYHSDALLPITLMILTKDGRVQIWQENLDPFLQAEDSPPISMNCIHTILHKVRPGTPFDCVYLYKNISEHSENAQVRSLNSVSPLLSPHFYDKVSLQKVSLKAKIFGSMVEPNYQGKVTKDVLVILSKNVIRLYGVIGLRNFPARQVDFMCMFKFDLQSQSTPKISSLVYSCDHSFQ